MKFLLHVDQFFDGATKKDLPLLERCNQETVSHGISGTGEPGTDPCKAHLVKEGRCDQFRLGAKNHHNGAAILRIFAGQEIVDIGGDVVLLMAAKA